METRHDRDGHKETERDTPIKQAIFFFNDHQFFIPKHLQTTVIKTPLIDSSSFL